METQFNKYQTELTDELLESLPTEVRDELLDVVNNVEFIRRLISPTREYAKDRPRDGQGRIIVDLCNPHILEDMDFFRESAIHYQKYGCYTSLRPNGNPNSEYGKWIRRERDRCWNGLVRPSDGEWIPGTMYFYLNYAPIVQNKRRKGTKQADRVVDFPKVWEGVYWRFHYIDQARNGGFYNSWEGALSGAELAARGRAIEVNEFVETPTGRKIWGDIHVGDLLFGTNNTITTVTDIPYEGVSPCYKITLRDKRTVIASDNHIWNVYKWDKEKIIQKTTIELFEDYIHSRKVTDRNPNGKEYVYSIPSNKGVEFAEISTKVDPYTFGLCLGDGSFKHQSCYFTCETEDFSNIRQFIPYEVVKWNSKFAYRIAIPSWGNILRDYNLSDKGSEDKFIPQEYKYNSRTVRLGLLQGLLDTDGYVSESGIPMFSTVSASLAEDIMWLTRSLGYNCSSTKRRAGYKKDGVYKRCKDVYIIKIYAGPECFRLPRKSGLVRYNSNYAKSRKTGTKIINIEYVGQRRCKCVTVDAIDSSFLIGNFIQTHNSKSYCMAAILARNFILGESKEASKEIRSLITAYQKEYLVKDGTLNKFLSIIDFCAQNTQFPARRLKSSLDKMNWQMGFVDLDTGTQKGTKNEVLGVTSKDDISKLRGKRSVFIGIEEFGSFGNLIDLYNTLIPSVKDGEDAFGMIYAQGTSGDKESDFAGAQELMYNPKGYGLYSLPNVFDKASQGKNYFVFFFGGYVNRAGCYNEDGVSDVTKALVEILMNRYGIKYNSSDPNTIIRTIAEIPITPSEAILRTKYNVFPVSDLLERLGQIDSNPSEFNDVYVGELTLRKGKIEFNPTDATPIREFPHKDNKLAGAVEIYQMPAKILDDNGVLSVPHGRYLLSCDPVDDDTSETNSLQSAFVLDLWTDLIVAEYTGRPSFAEDYYEQLRRLCILYNGRLNYENNKKGLFAYFSKMNSVYLLTETLEYLKDKDMVKGNLYGNKSRGTQASLPINNFARTLIRDWLLKPVTVVTKVDGKEVETQVPNLFRLRQRALIKELIQWNSEGNFDRVSSLGMLMLLREDRMIAFGGDTDRMKESGGDDLSNDDFFNRNYRGSRGASVSTTKVSWDIPSEPSVYIDPFIG